MKFLCKRILDASIALFGLIMCAPLMILIGIAIWLVMGRPILFFQDRPGFRGKIFKMVKFRTMRLSVGEHGDLGSDRARLTRLGIWLREFSLDELPELWNVLKGEMSIVGPRPLLPQYLSRYSPEQSRRHEMRPGITGWAQVNGRNSLSWEDKFTLDVWYVDNWSLSVDIKILLKTAWQVISREGVSSQGHATMPEFLGKRKELAEPPKDKR